MDLLNIYRAFDPKVAEYMFLPTAYGMFSNIDHILEWERKKPQSIKKKNWNHIKQLFFFFNHNAMRVEINYKKEKGENKQTNKKP